MANYLNGLGVALAESGKNSTAAYGTATGGKILSGGDANDALRGFSYVNIYAGGKGDDSYFTNNKYDTVIEKAGEGIDTVFAEQNFKLGAHVENLTLTTPSAWYGEGNSMDNIMTANLVGQTLNGGAGNDVLVSLAGNTTFIVARGNGSDAIYGFDATDRIRLDGYGITSFSSLKSLGSQVGADTVLKFGNGEQLVIRDTRLASLTADSFLLAHDTTGAVQTFSDDFNALSLYSKGGTWRTEYGWGGAGTLGSRTLQGEAEIYMDADYAGTGKNALGINPFKIDSGILTITAAPTPEAAKPFLGNAAYTSGLLTTKFTFSQQYGYFEISTKLPTGQGVWPAFWLLPTDNSWPPELDVFETLGRDTDTVFLTSHGVDADGKHIQTQSMVNLDYTQWHKYGVDWGPDTITYFIDGQAVATQATPVSMKGKDMYMLIDLAVGGGGWAGAYDATTGTREMQVDYVKAYATANTVSTTVNGVKTAYTPATTPAVTTPTVTPPVVTPPVVTPPVVTPPVVTTPVVTTPVVTTPTVTTPVVTPPVAPTPVAEAPKQQIGTAAADRLVAASNLSELWGYAGDDILRGDSFSTTMYGGLGNDTYFVVAANQRVVENVGEGADVVHSTISYTLGANIETLILDGNNNINGTGNDMGVRVVGNTGSNVITGGAGNDYLDGGTAGLDTIAGGKGDDTYYVNHVGTTVVEKAGEGTDNVRATISWTLGDNFETLVLEGIANINGTGNNAGNRLIGNIGNNILTGGTGNDALDGGTAGMDTLIGGAGNDTYYVNHTGTTLVERANEGIDAVHTTIGWTLGDNFETLQLLGTANINGTGNTLANRILGNAANNVLNGGLGDDTLTGGAGKDTFLFGKGGGRDVVNDFSLTDDYVQFTGFSKAALHIVQSGANTVIDFGGTDTITLLNTKAADPALLGHLIF